VEGSSAVIAWEERWNHNIHYHRILLDAVPDRCTSALDVGCGEGVLTRRLRRSIVQVCGIDADPDSIEIARRYDPASDIDYRLGDFLAAPFEPASFDFVVCAAALHHMDAEAALRRMRKVLRPGGTLAVLGLARSRYPADLPRDVAATLVSRAYRLTRRRWESPAPVLWPPPHTYREIKLLAERTLPRARFRRHLLWRYSITWTKTTA
jgi:2-polyprenyl-3-methyl-5-hydroxy-6-metoxy-1,4-benzoquinol methylase